MHDGVEHAGYLAFLGLLSLFPFLVFFVAIAGSFGEANVSTELVNFVIGKLPADVTAALTPRMKEIIEGPPQSLLTLAIVGVIWTSSSAVEGTRTILNRAYCVATPPAYIWRRLLSIAQFLGLTAALIIASFLIILVPALWGKLTIFLGVEHALDPILRHMGYWLSAFVVFLVVAISYYILPNIKQRMIDTAPGALIVTILWMLVSYLFTIFIENFNQVNVVYGSLAGIIIALIFFYLLAVLYIFGAEFNYFLGQAEGHKLIAKEKVKKPRRRKDDK